MSETKYEWICFKDQTPEIGQAIFWWSFDTMRVLCCSWEQMSEKSLPCLAFSEFGRRCWTSPKKDDWWMKCPQFPGTLALRKKDEE